MQIHYSVTYVDPHSQSLHLNLCFHCQLAFVNSPLVKCCSSFASFDLCCIDFTFIAASCTLFEMGSSKHCKNKLHVRSLHVNGSDTDYLTIKKMVFVLKHLKEYVRYDEKFGIFP